MESARPDVKHGQTAAMLMAPDFVNVRDQEPFCAFCSPRNMSKLSLSLFGGDI